MSVANSPRTFLEGSRSQEQKVATGRKRWPVVLLTLAVILWILPAILSTPPIFNRILAWATRDTGLSLRVESARLWWMSPVQLKGLELRDEQGELLAEIPRMESSNHLWKFVFNRTQLGSWKVESPTAEVVWVDGQSNWERALARLAEKPSDDSPAIAIKCDIADGKVSLINEQAGLSAEFGDLSAALQLPGASAEPILFAAKGNVDHAGQAGQFELQAEVGQPAAGESDQPSADDQAPGDKPSALPQVKASLSAEGLPLEVVNQLLAAWYPELQMQGLVSGKLVGSWEIVDGNPVQSVTSQDLRIENAEFALAGWGTDRLRLSLVELPCKVLISQDEVLIEDFALLCDLGEVQVQGRIDRRSGMGTALLNQDLTAQGIVDVARLSAMLPNVVHLKEDTQLEQGTVEFRLASQPTDTGRVLDGHLQATTFVAQTNGRKITWESPVEVTFAAHESAAGLEIDQVACHSDFLNVTAKGSAEDLELQVDCDLGKLAFELGRFLDLSGVALAGKSSGTIRFAQQPEGGFEFNLDNTITDLALGNAANPAFSEPHLHVTASAAGQAAGLSVTYLDTARLNCRGNSEELTLICTSPLDLTQEYATWPVSLEWNGQLEKLYPRLAGLLAPLGIQSMQGRAELTAQGDVGWNAADFRKAHLTVRPFDLAAESWQLKEQELTADGTFAWNLEERRFAAPQVTFATGALAGALEKVNLNFGSGPFQLSGRATWNGDLAQLQPLFMSAEKLQLQGQLRGGVDLDQRGKETRINLATEVENFLARETSGSAWQEPRLVLTGTAVYRAAEDTLDLESLALNTRPISLSCKGDIRKLTTQKLLQLSGELEYDLGKCERFLRPYLGDSIRLSGHDRRGFTLQGPLASVALAATRPKPNDPPQDFWAAQIQGDASVAWEWLHAYGFEGGPAELRGELTGGLIRFAPLNMEVNGGFVRSAPGIRLGPGPVMLEVPAGRMVDQVNITPEMCQSALQYVAPVLAGVTEAQGKFSVDMKGGYIPLGAPETGDAEGEMLIHSVEIGPGPLIKELSTILGNTESAKLAKESRVEFRLYQGRVYHRNLELVFPDVVVRTEGSVGLDQSLAITVVMPIPKKWLGNNPLGTALADRTIQLPINGTLSRPRVDQRRLQQLNAEFVRGAAGDALLDGLNRGLERALRPKNLPPR